MQHNDTKKPEDPNKKLTDLAKEASEKKDYSKLREYVISKITHDEKGEFLGILRNNKSIIAALAANDTQAAIEILDSTKLSGLLSDEQKKRTHEKLKENTNAVFDLAMKNHAMAIKVLCSEEYSDFLSEEQIAKILETHILDPKDLNVYNTRPLFSRKAKNVSSLCDKDSQKYPNHSIAPLIHELFRVMNPLLSIASAQIKIEELTKIGEVNEMISRERQNTTLKNYFTKNPDVLFKYGMLHFGPACYVLRSKDFTHKLKDEQLNKIFEKHFPTIIKRMEDIKKVAGGTEILRDLSDSIRNESRRLKSYFTNNTQLLYDMALSDPVIATNILKSEAYSRILSNIQLAEICKQHLSNISNNEFRFDSISSAAQVAYRAIELSSSTMRPPRPQGELPPLPAATAAATAPADPSKYPIYTEMPRPRNTPQPTATATPPPTPATGSSPEAQQRAAAGVPQQTVTVQSKPSPTDTSSTVRERILEPAAASSQQKKPAAGEHRARHDPMRGVGMYSSPTASSPASSPPDSPTQSSPGSPASSSGSAANSPGSAASSPRRK